MKFNFRFFIANACILVFGFFCFNPTANATNWDTGRGWILIEKSAAVNEETAQICHLWNAIIFAPKEKLSCSIGTVFVVDLLNRNIYYGVGETWSSLDGLKLKAEVLARRLNEGGHDQLEKLRDQQVIKRDDAIAAAKMVQDEKDAMQKRLIYTKEYGAAINLESIADFEKKYGNDDPDNLIQKLEPLKLQLETKQYQDRFDAAKSSSELQSFISEYESKDPDRLILEAKRRLAAVLMVEQAEQARLIREKLADEEKRKREQAVEQRANELARKKEAKDESRNRLQFIKNLRVRYSKNLTSESPHALEIVSSFIISCRAPDHRVLPLLNVLFAQIANAGSGFEFKLQIRSRGNAVRIYSDLSYKGKRLRETALAWEISEWNELRPVGITTEAVLNSCYGTQGPIWLMPDERL